MRIVFLHPDLGIGGAERLIVDAALALKAKGHDVKISTTYHNKDHCFPETKDGSLDVKVHGMWIPRSIFGRLIALFAYIRMIWATVFLVLGSNKPDVVIIDQISASIPLIRWFTKCKVLFYCHFPDLLLTDRKSLAKALYRRPLDYIEEKTTAMSHKHLVNSNFTKTVFKETFSTITAEPEVLHPSINLSAFDKDVRMDLKDVIDDVRDGESVFLSINRYERKKNLGLALKAFGRFLQNFSRSEQYRYRLIMAGGYDERVEENVSYHAELMNQAADLEISSRVTFLKSPDESTKIALLRNAKVLLYTPDKEHFGIVPLEAMYCKVPVIAVNSGGPTETVRDGETGFLVNPEEDAFCHAMRRIVGDDSLRIRMGIAGRRRVVDVFSFDAFANNLDRVVTTLANVE